MKCEKCGQQIKRYNDEYLGLVIQLFKIGTITLLGFLIIKIILEIVK